MKNIILLLISVLVAISCKSQKYDTTKVVVLYSDTSRSFDTKWMYGYSVGEIHSESEGIIDWYFDHTAPPKNFSIHIYYLDEKKKRLRKNILVWQYIPINLW